MAVALVELVLQFVWPSKFGICQVIQKAVGLLVLIIFRIVPASNQGLNAMANVEDIPFIVEDRRMLSRVAGDRSEFGGWVVVVVKSRFDSIPCSRPSAWALRANRSLVLQY